MPETYGQKGYQSIFSAKVSISQGQGIERGRGKVMGGKKMRHGKGWGRKFSLNRRAACRYGDTQYKIDTLRLIKLGLA
jgi:hypothetical protein